MSFQTLFTCEKCGKTWDTKDKECPQVVNVACRVNYSNAYHAFDNNYGPDVLSANWCRPCLTESGVVTPKKKDGPGPVASTPEPTTEDRLIELLETLGFTREH